MSEASEAALKGGALFYVTLGSGGKPLFCGFFTSPTVALTINHDAMFTFPQEGEALPLIVYAVSSAGRALKFSVFSTNVALDFTVLKLQSDCAPSPSWFHLQTYSSIEPGLAVGLVTMGIGVGKELRDSPTITQHRVNVTSCDDGTFFLYDGGSTWRGDSGAALLFEDGVVVGMHLEVVDDKPMGYVSPRGGVKRDRDGHPVKRRVAAVEGQQLALEAAVESVSVAASSQAKVCRALLLLLPAGTLSAATVSPALDSYGDSQLAGLGDILHHRIQQEPLNFWVTLIFLGAHALASRNRHGFDVPRSLVSLLKLIRPSSSEQRSRLRT